MNTELMQHLWIWVDLVHKEVIFCITCDVAGILLLDPAERTIIGLEFFFSEFTITVLNTVIYLQDLSTQMFAEL